MYLFIYCFLLIEIYSITLYELKFVHNDDFYLNFKILFVSIVFTH